MFIKKTIIHPLAKIIILNTISWLTCVMQASASETYDHSKASHAILDECCEETGQSLDCEACNACSIDLKKRQLENTADASTRDDSSEKIIVFACQSNSCRSQMAEGWAREWIAKNQNESSPRIRVYSVALNEDIVEQKKTRVIKAAAIEAMAESEIYIESYRIKTLCEVASEISADLNQPNNQSKRIDKLVVLCSCEGQVKQKLELLSKSVEVWNIEAPSHAQDKDLAYYRVSLIIRDQVFALMDQINQKH